MSIYFQKKAMLVPVFLLTVFCAFMLSTGVTGCAKKETAQEFATRVMESAIRGWDADALYELSSERFRSAATKQDVHDMFTHYTELGKLNSYEPPVGQVVNETLPDGSTAELGAYQVSAEFENDDVTVVIVAISENNGWTLYGFSINSNYVMSMMESQKQNIEEIHQDLEESFPRDNAAD